MIEYEKKILLSETEYLTILMTMFDGINPTIYKNYYYDTEAYEMNENGITYRIRKKGEKYKPAIKYHVKHIADLSIEYEYDTMESLNSKVFENEDLILQGSLMCERRIINFSDSIRVILDKNDYLEYTDYELEIEYEKKEKDLVSEVINFLSNDLCVNGHKTCIRDLLCRAANAKSKSERFIEMIKATRICKVSQLHDENINILMKQGEKRTINYTIATKNSANTKMTWYSSNKKIVSVEDGLICAHQVGSAVLVSVALNEKSAANAYLVTVIPKEANVEEKLQYKDVLESLFGFSTDDPDHYIK